MAGNEGEVDVEGIRRGRCNTRECPCPQYFRRVNSVSCNCGHTGHKHEEIMLCRGTVVGGGSCDCRSYRSPPAPYMECLNCGHTIVSHSEFPSGGRRGNGGELAHSGGRSGGEGETVRSGGTSGGEGGMMSLETARAAIREFTNSRRSEDYTRRVSSEANRSLRGGFSTGPGGLRPGAGRKPACKKDLERIINVAPGKFEEGKTTLSRAGLNRFVTVKGDVTILELKELCRREFQTSLKMDLTAFAEERMFKNFQGGEIFDDATGKQLSFKTCCYYHPEFDSLVTYKPKRRSQHSFVEGEGMDEDERRTKRQRYGGEGDGEYNDDVEQPTDQSFGVTDENPVIPNAVGENSVDSNAAEDNKGEHNPDEPNSGGVDQSLLDYNPLSHLTQTYGITGELANLLLDFCGGEGDRANAWLQEVLCGGPDCETAVKELHSFFAFGDRGGGESDNEDDRQYIQLRTFKENEGPSLRDQIILQWKSKKGEFNKLASVKFDQGMGNGPRNTYLQCIREYVVAPLFEGAQDHVVVTAAIDQLMGQEYYLGGQFMGHIVRHGQAVFAGLADVSKCAFRDLAVERLYAAMEDLPSFETQQLLQKVLSGGAGELTDDENTNLRDLISDSGMKTGYTWVAPTANTQGYYQIKEGECNNVATQIIQNIVLFKRMAQLNQLIDGFNDVCKFKAFIRICGGAGASGIVDALISAYFPTVNECSMTKDELLGMITTVAQDGEENYQAQLSDCIVELVGKLDANPNAAQSVSKFVQLCTGCSRLPVGSSITFNVVDYCDFKVKVCSKSVDVSKNWFESKETKETFVDYVLREVRDSCQVYTSA